MSTRLESIVRCAIPGGSATGAQMRLVPEGALAAAVRLGDVRQHFPKYAAEMLGHPTAGWGLRNYVILSECPELLADQE